MFPGSPGDRQVRPPFDSQSLRKFGLQKKYLEVADSCANINICERNGSVPEWLMGADCKSAGYAYAGSNPARPTTNLSKRLRVKSKKLIFYIFTIAFLMPV